MSEHTKEPWEAISPCEGKCCWNIKPVNHDEYEFAPEINHPEMSEANAKRIVACVNACAGWTTLFLESIVTLGETLQSRSNKIVLELHAKEAQLTAQKDITKELVEALNRFVNNSSVQLNQPFECEYAEALIKKAEEMG